MTEYGLEHILGDVSNSPVNEIALLPHFIFYIFIPTYGSTLSFSKIFLYKI